MIHITSKTHSRLATAIVSFDAGSRVEAIKGYNAGIAHMLEHSIFKGSVNRTASEINRQMAYYGGSMNAYTSHENVAYYVTAPVDTIEPCLDILSDIVFNPIFPEDEFLKEKEVVTEEEISTNDQPMRYFGKIFFDNLFDNYLADPVIGTQESIARFTNEEVKSFYKEYCTKEHAVISLCSNLSKGKSSELLKKYFGKPTGRIKPVAKFSMSNYLDSRVITAYKPGIEHTYVLMGMPTLPLKSNLGGAVEILNTIMGSGMDSRLFAEVREGAGLVYQIGSSYNDYQNGAVTLISFSTREQNVESAIQIIDDQLSAIKLTPPTEEEVQRAKNKIKASFYSAIEDSYSIANWDVKRKLFDYPTVDEYLFGIDLVTPEAVMEAANRLYEQDKRLTLICRGR